MRDGGAPRGNGSSPLAEGLARRNALRGHD